MSLTTNKSAYTVAVKVSFLGAQHKVLILKLEVWLVVGGLSS